MGTTAQKLEYLGTTKSQLKTMISYGYPLSNETFRQYVGGVFKALINSMSDTLNATWNNLPKLTTTPGTSQSINNTIEAPMRIELGSTELTQDATPTPTSPQAVHTITGENIITTCGKNLLSVPLIQFNANTLRSDIPNFKAGEYTFSYSSNLTATWQTTARKIVNGASTQLEAKYNNNTISFTLDEEATLQLEVYRTGILLTNVWDIMLNKGSTATTYEPYKGNSYEVNLGKNISNFDIDSAYGITFNTNDITIKNPTNYNYADNWNLKNDTSLSGATYTIYAIANGTTDGTRTISLNVAKTGTSYAWQMQFPTSQTTYNNFVKVGTVVLGASEVFTGISIYIPGSMNADLNIKVMVVKGSYTEQTIGNYAPYFTPIEYCKIGNYEDSFIRTTGKNKFNNEMSSTINLNASKSTLSSGVRILTTTSSQWVGCVFAIENAQNYKGKKLTLSANVKPSASNKGYMSIITCDSDGNNRTNLISSDLSGDVSINATIPTNTADGKYIGIVLDANSSGTGSANCYVDYTELQLELGEKTSYEPYGKNEWWLKKAIGKVVLDGSEMWGNSGAANTLYSTSIIDYAISNNIPVSNYYSGISNVAGSGGMVDQSNNTIAFINVVGQTTPRFYVKDTRYENSQYNDFKTWLSSNPLIVYYALATPTYTQITGELATQLENVYNSQSQDGQTNINQINDDLSFNMSVSALENLS